MAYAVARAVTAVTLLKRTGDSNPNSYDCKRNW